MRVLFIPMFLLFYQLVCHSQTPLGKYYNEEQFLEFTNDSVMFNIYGNGGLLVELIGYGEYKILEDYLIINTAEYSGRKSYFIKEEKPSNINSTLKITDDKYYSLIGVGAGYLDSKGKSFSGTVSDTNGIAHIDTESNIKKLRITFPGYDECYMDYNPSFNYKIILTQGNVLENESIILKFKYLKRDRISLAIIGIIPTKNKPTLKALKKIEKNLNTYFYTERIYTKT